MVMVEITHSTDMRIIIAVLLIFCGIIYFGNQEN